MMEKARSYKKIPNKDSEQSQGIVNHFPGHVR